MRALIWLIGIFALAVGVTMLAGVMTATFSSCCRRGGPRFR